MIRTRRRFGAGVLLALLTLLGTALGSRPAWADVAVAITPGAVRLTDPVQAGSTVTLPALTVTNKGSAAATITMATVLVRDTDRNPVHPEWAAYDPATFTLDPDAAGKVTATLTIPGDSADGVYEALLQASVRVDPTTSTTAAPAVAARVVFELTTVPPWWHNKAILIAAGLVLLALAALLVRYLIRRSGYTLTFTKADTNAS